MKFLEAIRNMFRIPDLRRRLLFTLGLLAVYRVGAYITIPGINVELLQQFFEQNRGSALGLIDIFSGGNLRNMTIFALGIMPYITASIILQLLAVVWPYLERLQKEGELGRRKITQWTRYMTVALATFQGFTIAMTLQQGAAGNVSYVLNPGWGFTAMTVLTLTTGTIFIMWLGEQISDRGIGNGMSLIIFAGIVVGLPGAVFELFRGFQAGQRPLPHLIALTIMMAAVVAFIVFVEGGQRRIPVQYAKRVVGRRMMGGSMTYLPIRVNAGGVIPVIFASSVLTFPQTIVAFVPQDWRFVRDFAAALAWGEPLYNLLYIVGIIFFCYFYVSIIFNPDELADNMRKMGGFIPGIRPGRHTSEYVNTVLTRLTFVGGLYLAFISIIPEWMISGIHLHHLPGALGAWIDANFPRAILEGLGVNFYFGGTSLLIIVGVAMDTVNQIEAQLTMRHYDGFTAKGRIRGRRG